MGDRLGILGAVGYPFSCNVLRGSRQNHVCRLCLMSRGEKRNAPSEARTHGLQIMRLTRCLLRYRGGWHCSATKRNQFSYLEMKAICNSNKKGSSCDGRESNPGQLLGRQLCSPLYHQRFVITRWLKSGIVMEHAKDGKGK